MKSSPRSNDICRRVSADFPKRIQSRCQETRPVVRFATSRMVVELTWDPDTSTLSYHGAEKMKSKEPAFYESIACCLKTSPKIISSSKSIRKGVTQVQEGKERAESRFQSIMRQKVWKAGQSWKSRELRLQISVLISRNGWLKREPLCCQAPTSVVLIPFWNSSIARTSLNGCSPMSLAFKPKTAYMSLVFIVHVIIASRNLVSTVFPWTVDWRTIQRFGPRSWLWHNRKLEKRKRLEVSERSVSLQLRWHLRMSASELENISSQRYSDGGRWIYRCPGTSELQSRFCFLHTQSMHLDS